MGGSKRRTTPPKRGERVGVGLVHGGIDQHASRRRPPPPPRCLDRTVEGHFVRATTQPMSTSQQALEYLSQQELVVAGICEGIKDPHPFLGGLGVDKTRELAEERASDLRCGNVTCSGKLVVKYPSCPVDSVGFLRSQNMQLVSGRELEQFCSERCLLEFRVVLGARPLGDVWDMQRLALKSATMPSVKPLVSSVGEIKERGKAKKAKRTLATTTTATKPGVSFAPQIVSQVVEIPAIKRPWEEDSSDDDEDDDFGDVGRGLLSFMERMDFSTIQLSLFAQVSNLLMDLTTPGTRQWLEIIPSPSTSIDLSRIHPQLLVNCLQALHSLIPEPQARLPVEQNLPKILVTLDNTRPSLGSAYSSGFWLVFTAALLGAMGKTNPLQHFPFHDANWVVQECFAHLPELREIDSALFSNLVATVYLACVVRDPASQRTILDVVHASHRITVHALQFLKLYLLSCFENGVKLPLVTEHLVVSIMNVLCEESEHQETRGRRCNPATLTLKQKLLEFHREHYKLTMTNPREKLGFTNKAQLLHRRGCGQGL
ncbi:hypothetical protein BASA81_001791 [Batrachochytrium salamandrivorans]|nr:hypothetical protein BASA81_001791 [Batrachochytrium salamandrivorans]